MRTHRKCLAEALLLSTLNICFRGEIRQQNINLISILSRTEQVTAKPVLKVTSIKQSFVFKGHFFGSTKGKLSVNLPVLSTSLATSFRFPQGACLTQV